MRICKEQDCTEELVPRKNARGYCWNHYMQWQRANSTTHNQACAVCGKTFTSFGARRKCCSTECASMHGAKARSEAAAHRRPTKNCSNCNKTLPDRSTRKTCSAECASSFSVKSPLRIAVERNEHQSVIEEIRKRSAEDQNGCWNWEGKLNDGYPAVKFGKKTIGVHRISLEAKHGKELGPQTAHHKCANTKCVNPEHLQPVTHRENTAEMLARRSYLNRIRELEQALEQIDQNHPLLAQIEVA